jgi:hypothetical protein
MPWPAATTAPTWWAASLRARAAPPSRAFPRSDWLGRFFAPPFHRQDHQADHACGKSKASLKRRILASGWRGRPPSLLLSSPSPTCRQECGRLLISYFPLSPYLYPRGPDVLDRGSYRLPPASQTSNLSWHSWCAPAGTYSVETPPPTFEPVYPLLCAEPPGADTGADRH